MDDEYPSQLSVIDPDNQEPEEEAITPEEELALGGGVLDAIEAERAEDAKDAGHLLVGAALTPSDDVKKLTQVPLSEDVRSFTSDIDRNRFNKSQLTTRLNARNGRALTDAGYPADNDGRETNSNRAATENRMVTPEQRELLLRTYEERKETREATTQTECALQQIQDTASFYRDVFSGKYNLSQLTTRLNARNGRALTDAGYPADNDGRETNSNRAATENRMVTPEQRELLRAAYRERLGATDAAKQGERGIKQIQDTASFYQDILNGRFSRAQLVSRLNARNGRALTDAGYPADNDGRETNSNRAATENRTVSEEQKGMLLQTYDRIIELKKQLSPDQQERLRKLDPGIMQGVLAATERERSGMQVTSEVESSDKALDILQGLQAIIRRGSLYEKFSEALQQKNDTFEAAKAVLAQNDSQDPTDVARVRDLKQELANITLRDAGRLVADATADPEEALKLIRDRASFLGPDVSLEIQDIVACAQRRLLLSDYFEVFNGAQTDNLAYQERLQQLMKLPVRPDTAGFKYFDERRNLVASGTEVLVQARRAEIRRAFADKALGADGIIDAIMDLPLSSDEDLQLQEELLDKFALYIAARRKERPEDFDVVFSEEARRTRERLMPNFPESLELGRNLKASKYVAENFRDTVGILFQALRGDSRTADVADYIKPKNGKEFGRESFVIDADLLDGQRSLTNIERAYLESVELLSVFNPHLAAVARENPEVSRIFLANHFMELSQRTKEQIVDGQYYPLIHVGLGPNGLTDIGELARINPDLIRQSLIIDGAELPGGPFAVPGGPAWDLNSANERGNDVPTLPADPADIAARTGVEEEKTVRAYGSPLPFYPGERSGSAVRPGSINTTADYLITPDDLSDSRYPTNDELALVLQLQAALLVKNMALRTELVKVEPNPDTSAPGNKLATLRIFSNGESTPRLVTVQTSAVSVAAGLGEPGYGFRVEGSRAEQILQANKFLPEEEFPRLSDTLTAFRALANQEGTQKQIGGTLIIYGGGNSADTLLENIGGLFEGDNPSVRNVQKIYVITEEDLSKRPRYAQIRDLRPRGGKDSLVEIVSGRVGDVDYIDTVDANDRLTVLDQSGRPLRDADGQQIIGDTVIAATGFRPALDKVFSAYLQDDQSLRKGDAIKRLTLPTNQDVSVADVLEADPTVIFTGTASRADFENPDKLAQLPPEARQALVENGAENAVAIGFRRPDDQAAMRLFAQTLIPDVALRTSNLSDYDAPKEIALQGSVTAGSRLEFQVNPAVATTALRREVASDSQVLTPLFLYGLGRIKEDLKPSGAPSLTNATISFSLLKGDKGTLTLQYDGANGDATVDGSTSPGLMATVMHALDNPILQAYAFNAKSTRRKQQGLRIELNFRNGRLNGKYSFVEPI